MPQIDNELATRLIKARSDKGWSQADLANESGVAAAQISRYEQGRSKPRPEVLSKLAKAMGVDFSWLSMGLSVTDDPPPLDLCLDKALHERLSAAAIASGRSLHTEVCSRLEKSFEVMAGSTPLVMAKLEQFLAESALAIAANKLTMGTLSTALRELAEAVESGVPVDPGRLRTYRTLADLVSQSSAIPKAELDKVIDSAGTARSTFERLALASAGEPERRLLDVLREYEERGPLHNPAPDNE